jgi:hypothetical protein
MIVERLCENKSPEVANPVVKPWVKVTQSPIDGPRLRDSVDGASLMVAGTQCARPGNGMKPMIAADEVVRLS